MALFTDSDDVYCTLGGLIAELVGDQRVQVSLREVDAIVQAQLRDPQATITADLRRDHEPTLVLGATTLEPEITITASSDIAHLLWLSRLDPTIALARDQMAAKGPIERLLAALAAAGPPGPRYEARLVDAGRADLLDVADADPRVRAGLAARA